MGLVRSEESTAHGEVARSLTRSTIGEIWGDNGEEATLIRGGVDVGSSV